MCRISGQSDQKYEAPMADRSNSPHGSSGMHGRDEVAVISAEEARRPKGGMSGQALVEALQSSPHRDFEIEPGRTAMPVRNVEL
jgi:hypothetical protein